MESSGFIPAHSQGHPNKREITIHGNILLEVFSFLKKMAIFLCISLVTRHLQKSPVPSPRCEKLPQITPTLALPRQGGGNFSANSICLPSPLAREGRGREKISFSSHLPL
jgi:hypothetical protein